MMRRLLVVAGLGLLAGSSGCTSDRRPSRAESAASTTISTAASLNRWDDSLGAVIAVPSLDDGSPVLFSRDSIVAANVEMEFFSHDSLSFRSTLHAGGPRSGCAYQRAAAVASAAQPASTGVWSLALAPGTATPFSVDAIADLPPRDSAAFIVRINRLVSALPEDSSSGPFHGLPIVVRDAWRFTLPDSTPVAVALTTRSINVESNPRTELVMLIAERDAPQGEWHAAYARRETGPEDRIEGADLLAALLLRKSAPMVVFVREGDRGPQVDFVGRDRPATWQLRWSTAAMPCPRG